MNSIDQDMQIRITVFDWVSELLEIYDNAIPSRILWEGLTIGDIRVTLLNQPGIWKPAVMDFPLTIKTTLKSPYYDKQIGDYLEYSYCNGGPYYKDNVALRNSMKNQRPLIYLIETMPQKYFAQFPAYIEKDDMPNSKFIVSFDKYINNQVEIEPSEIRRQYVTREVKQRIHQTKFREQVLHAYKCQCTLCRLKHRELLDAAHIIPDSEEQGIAKVTNGLSLCKIHHAAFDRNIIGISPEYKVKVRDEILHEIDGPMLRYGIQKLNNHKIILPHFKKNWPDRERLEQRYNKFISV